MNSNTQICEYLIIGAGITGLTVANELLDRGAENILIIEKENFIGKHASGRNSGVLHAGIYYTPDSLKARYCVEGNRLLKQFCLENNIDLNVSGKVLVVDSDKKLEGLKLIKDRADKNGVESELINETRLKEIEPYAYTYKEALYSPNTAVFNPLAILEALQKKVLDSNKCKMLFDTKFIKLIGNQKIKTSTCKIKFNYLVNAAGSYADKIAKEYYVGNQYKAIPFMGTYLEVKKEKSHLVNGNIYPVPDIRNPFLGIHFTKSIDGKIYIGPTAIPVLGREQYELLEGLSLESFNILLMNVLMFFRNNSFRSNALSEMKKYFKNYIINEAKKLVPSLEKDYVKKSAKRGIRPQLVDTEKKELVMDYLVIKESNTIHVLNAISPAFTSSMAFAKFICDMFE